MDAPHCIYARTPAQVGRYAPVVMSTKLYDYFLDEGSGPTAMGILSNITGVIFYHNHTHANCVRWQCLFNGGTQ